MHVRYLVFTWCVLSPCIAHPHPHTHTQTQVGLAITCPDRGHVVGVVLLFHAGLAVPKVSICLMSHIRASV